MKVFVLASGNSKIGKGHISRSLMLVRKLREQGVRSYYFSYDNDEGVKAEITKEASSILVANHTIDAAETYTEIIKSMVPESETALLYVDSDYEPFYSESFQKSIVASGVKLMYATIKSEHHFHAHLVLNQNVLALSQAYSTEVYTKKMLGPKYFLWPEKAMHIEPKLGADSNNKPNSLFVNFGNADPNDLTYKIWRIIKLNRSLFTKVVIVVGNLYKGFDKLKEEMEELADPTIHLYQNPSNIYELMQSCSLGISSMGMTFWELTYMKIPSLILSGSERERRVCDFISQENYAIKMGDFADEDWEVNWSVKLRGFVAEIKNNRLKTLDLKAQINIHGIDLVVDEIMGLS